MEESVVSVLETTAADGKQYKVKYYNLDAIIAVGYRVNSKKATMYLDYAERQARRGNIMYMQDWIHRLDAFLQFNEEDVLQDKGKVTAAIARTFAENEFEKFRFIQDRTYQSDFDRLIAEIEESGE